MYNFRYHLITICSIFIALALGLLLGAAIASSELAQTTSDDMVESMLSRYETLTGENNRLQTELQDNTILASSLSDAWAAERLDGRIIVLLLGNTLEDRSLQSDITESLVQAGGSVVNVTVLQSDFGLESEGIRTTLEGIVEVVPSESYQLTLAKRLAQEWSYVFTTTSLEPAQEDFDILPHTYFLSSESTAPVPTELEGNPVDEGTFVTSDGMGGPAPQTDFQKIIYDRYPLTRALLTYGIISVSTDYSNLLNHLNPSPPPERQAALAIATAWQLPYGVNGLINGLAQQQDNALMQTQIGLQITLSIQQAGAERSLIYPSWLKANIPESSVGNVAMPNYFTLLIQPSHLKDTMDILASENSLSCVTSPESVSGRFSIIALLTGAQAGIYGNDRPPESRFAPMPKDTSGRAVFK